MKEKLEQCFERLQNLDIKPTLGNMELLVQTLYDLREIYNELNKEEGPDGRAEADPEGRDAD
jgi:hypothetical protein